MFDQHFLSTYWLLRVKIFLIKLHRPHVFQVDHAKYLHASVPKLYINSLEEGVGKASRCINVTAHGSIAVTPDYRIQGSGKSCMN